MSTIITLTTDFGFTDAYVAAMKGVILGINPEAKLVDICHSIKPQDVGQAAFILSTVYQFFPQGTIHLVVVDPGVGAERRLIILRTPRADFVAPDNGVLSYVIRQSSTGILEESASGQLAKLGDDTEAVAITRQEFWRSPVSPTFHGRDILAPVAARLSLGLPPADFGERINSVVVLPFPRPYLAKDGSLVGHVIHIDNFGNLVTNIRADDLRQIEPPIAIRVGSHLIHGLSRTYADGKGLLALIGSSGYLEVALNGGSACQFLQAEIGDVVKVQG